jgi:hypothetical protein
MKKKQTNAEENTRRRMHVVPAPRMHCKRTPVPAHSSLALTPLQHPICMDTTWRWHAPEPAYYNTRTATMHAQAQNYTSPRRSGRWATV